jgi:hypothetical protein
MKDRGKQGLCGAVEKAKSGSIIAGEYFKKIIQ